MRGRKRNRKEVKATCFSVNAGRCWNFNASSLFGSKIPGVLFSLRIPALSITANGKAGSPGHRSGEPRRRSIYNRRHHREQLIDASRTLAEGRQRALALIHKAPIAAEIPDVSSVSLPIPPHSRPQRLHRGQIDLISDDHDAILLQVQTLGLRGRSGRLPKRARPDRLRRREDRAALDREMAAPPLRRS